MHISVLLQQVEVQHELLQDAVHLERDGEVQLVSTGSAGKNNVYLRRCGGVSAIVHVEVVVAVQLQQVEVQHEPLQDAVRLERDGAVQVALISRPEYPAIQLAILPL